MAVGKYSGPDSNRDWVPDSEYSFLLWIPATGNRQLVGAEYSLKGILGPLFGLRIDMPNPNRQFIK